MLQHFMKKQVSPIFYSEHLPQLYYMGKVLPEISSYPRILHSHAEHVEISIIYSGTSEYLIGDQRQLIRPAMLSSTTPALCTMSFPVPTHRSETTFLPLAISKYHICAPMR